MLKQFRSTLDRYRWFFVAEGVVGNLLFFVGSIFVARLDAADGRVALYRGVGIDAGEQRGRRGGAEGSRIVIMPTRGFQPGFRISAVDVGVLVLAGVAAAYAWNLWPSLTAIILYVVLHFFLFCNIARVARSLELLWAAVFVMLGSLTVLTGWPGWIATFGLTLIATVAVVAMELRKPSYHGVGWQWINPSLPEWWAAQEKSRVSGAEDGPAR